MKETSSKYNLCADFGLSKLKSIQWFFYCLQNNKNPLLNLDRRLLFKRQKISDIQEINKIDFNSSPSRALCDIFWNNLNWNEFKFQLIGNFKIMEMGCGSGVYGDKFYNLLGDSLEFYRGVDIIQNSKWEEYSLNKKLEFSLGNANLVSEHLNDINCIFTQSALEHFPADITYFSQISSYVKKCKYPVLQIHLMPSSACLKTYLLHGYRHYTPRSISSITNCFDDNSTFELFFLGGKKCNNLHFNYITLPGLLFRSDFRKIFFNRYKSKLVNSILKDSNSDDDLNPSFYALIIKSNFK